MKITNATQEEMQMLASCVYSAQMAARHELTTLSKTADPAKLERGKQLAALLDFCGKFMQGVQNPFVHETPNAIPSDLAKHMKKH